MMLVHPGIEKESREMKKKDETNGKTDETAVEKSVHDQVKEGTFTLPEIETLRLQKLKHQSDGMMATYQNLVIKANETREKGEKIAQQLTQEINKTYQKYGFEKWFEIDLSDEKAGVVRENIELKRRLEEEASKPKLALVDEKAGENSGS